MTVVAVSIVYNQRGFSAVLGRNFNGITIGKELQNLNNTCGFYIEIQNMLSNMLSEFHEYCAFESCMNICARTFLYLVMLSDVLNMLSEFQS